MPWGSCREHTVLNPVALSDLLGELGHSDATAIARGLGRSYGDAAINDGGDVILSRKLDCFRGFDETTAMLDCEAGVSFAQIIQEFLPRGWFLPTTPGTKFVTIGGAIAADVHGKNHHRVGSFGEFVEDFQLMLASGARIRCSRSENPDAFFATLGGMGLTGVILSARFRLVPVETASIAVRYRKTVCLEESLDAFDSGDADYEHSVAWVDCLAGGASLGRGVVMQGNHARREDLPAELAGRPFSTRPARPMGVPFVPRRSLLNRVTVQVFNELFYWTHREGPALVDVDRFFYPLDSISRWNLLYGRHGFVQYQAFFPTASSRQGLRDVLNRVVASGEASFLAVLKRCGKPSGGLLSYLEPGHTLALDLPFRLDKTPALCRDLDAILLHHGGRIYMAKDSTTDARTFRSMYPRLPEFIRIKERLDPEGRFSSSLARRLEIVRTPRPPVNDA